MYKRQTVDTVAANVQMEVDITIGQLKIREKGGRADRQYISVRMHGREFHIIKSINLKQKKLRR